MIEWIDRSTLPANARGAKSEPRVSIRDSGQIYLTKAAAEIVGDSTHVEVGFDREAKKMVLRGRNPMATKLPKGLSQSALFPIASGKSGWYFHGAGALLSYGYDFASSGNQIFPAARVNGIPNSIEISLPFGALPLIPVRKRKRRSAVSGAPVTAAAVQQES